MFLLQSKINEEPKGTSAFFDCVTQENTQSSDKPCQPDEKQQPYMTVYVNYQTLGENGDG
jgi:hypothetical protein